MRKKATDYLLLALFSGELNPKGEINYEISEYLQKRKLIYLIDEQENGDKRYIISRKGMSRLYLLFGATFRRQGENQ